MAQTVSQHSVASFTSPVNGTSPIDANQVRGNDNTLRSGYNDHDADPGIHLQSSAVASRPAAGDLGRKWLTTDTGAVRLYFDTGSAWAEASYLPLAGGTVAGNVSITGTLAVTSAITATGGVVGNVTGNVTGNASTATALATARTINGVSFDGTANITVTADAGTLTGSTLASGVTASSLTSVGTLANLTVTNPITGSVTGNAATATALQTARTINGTSFDGTANITVTADAGTLTGTTLNSSVVSSSLTSVGTLTSGTIGSGFTAIANSALANSSVTVNGTAIALGASGTVTAAAGTLTGSTLAGLQPDQCWHPDFAGRQWHYGAERADLHMAVWRWQQWTGADDQRQWHPVMDDGVRWWWWHDDQQPDGWQLPDGRFVQRQCCRDVRRGRDGCQHGQQGGGAR